LIHWLDVQGYHGIDEEIFISLPVVVGESGITSVFNQRINDEERAKIQKSAKTLREVLDGVKFWCFRLYHRVPSVSWRLSVVWLFVYLCLFRIPVPVWSLSPVHLRVVVIYRTQGTIRVVIVLFISDVIARVSQSRIYMMIPLISILLSLL